jgi:hypothetical protein
MGNLLTPKPSRGVVTENPTLQEVCDHSSETLVPPSFNITFRRSYFGLESETAQTMEYSPSSRYCIRLVDMTRQEERRKLLGALSREPKSALTMA